MTNLQHTQINNTTLVTEENSAPLSKIDFYGCFINEPKTIKMLIKNTSGINTEFNVSTAKYAPYLLNNNNNNSSS
jgi:hypothetical protein